MKRYETFFLIIVIVCLVSFAMFMIGGAIQDIDYHDLSKLPLTQQQDEYARMQTRKSVGEKIQLVSAIFVFVGFLGVAITALTVGTANAEKQLKKAEQAKARQ